MCMAAGLEPPSHVHVHGWLLIGRPEALQDHGRRRARFASPTSRRSMLTNEFGVDPLRYYLLRETALGNDGEFSLEGITQRYNTDLANNLGNLVARVATVVGSKCAGRRSGALARLRRCAPTAERGDRRRGGGVGATSRPTPRSRPPGASSARRTPTSSSTRPGRWSPAPDVDAVLGDALEAIRLVAILVSPAMPAVCRRDLAAHRPRRVSPTRAALRPRRARGAATPAGSTVEKGEPLFPRIESDA